MYRPGSTHRSCPVSKTRIFSSRSSNFILPLLDDKPIGFVDPYVEQFVEAFFPAGEFHSRRRSEDAAHRNPLLGGTLLVAALAVLDARLEVIADHPEARAPGGFDVHLPLHAGGVRVVHDERLAGLDARLQETVLAVPGLEHVEVNAQVRGKEAFAVERRFACSL